MALLPADPFKHTPCINKSDQILFSLKCVNGPLVFFCFFVVVVFFWGGGGGGGGYLDITFSMEKVSDKQAIYTIFFISITWHSILLGHTFITTSKFRINAFHQ